MVSFAGEVAGGLVRDGPRVPSLSCRSCLDGLLILGTHLHRLQLDGDFVQLAIKGEWPLIVFVFDGCAGVGADIEAFIHAEGDRDAVRDRPPRHFLAIQRQHSRPAFPEPRAIVVEVEGDAVLAERERLFTLPAKRVKPTRL